MTTPTEPPAEEASGPRSKEQIEAEIQATRVQLGRTVDELSHRLDVKSRVKEQVAAGREQATRRMQEQPAIPVAAAAGVVLLLTLVVWRRRRRK
ncbi:MAG TPA: DUF3618 domain-containing protein [Marmoricola sp.]|nr:DUF3618 domain-containing protein [Marmoricola sp.]